MIIYIYTWNTNTRYHKYVRISIIQVMCIFCDQIRIYLANKHELSRSHQTHMEHMNGKYMWTLVIVFVMLRFYLYTWIWTPALAHIFSDALFRFYPVWPNARRPIGHPKMQQFVVHYHQFQVTARQIGRRTSPTRNPHSSKLNTTLPYSHQHVITSYYQLYCNLEEIDDIDNLLF